MAENCKIYNLTSFTDEELERVEALINQIEEEKKKKTQKWWIVPKYNLFSNEESQFGESYIVEEQKDSYSRSRPPLKSDFNSKKEAEMWLHKHIVEKFMFDSARDDLNDLILGLDLLRGKLNKHEKITQDEWDACFRRVNKSALYGDLYQVIEWNEKVEQPNSPKIKIIKEGIL
jgi:hypothetical protein